MAVEHGTLYLIPVTLGGDQPEQVLPSDVIKKIHQLQRFIVEQEKNARHFLSLVKHPTPIRTIQLSLLNEHTRPEELKMLIDPLLNGEDVGLMSDAGCPGVADPGASVVDLAHRHHINVRPLVGPSSILLALMGSGLCGQRFTFHGYLPSEKSDRIKTIRKIEQQSKSESATQIFIETPYRNQHMIDDLLAHCHNNTRLCIAADLTLENEFLITKTIAQWKHGPLPSIQKRPALFLILA